MDAEDIPSKGGGLLGMGAAALANAFKSHKVKGFDHPTEYQAQRKILRGPEYGAIKAVVKDGRLRKWCRLGIRLRGLQGEDAEVQRMKQQFLQNDGPEALFVAQAIQVGLLQKLISLLQERGYSANAQAEQVEYFLRHIQRHLLLVNAGDNEKNCSARALSALRQNPVWYCIAGSGDAQLIAARVAADVFPSATSHDLHPLNETNRFTGFFRLLTPGEAPSFKMASPKKAKKKGR